MNIPAVPGGFTGFSTAALLGNNVFYCGGFTTGPLTTCYKLDNGAWTTGPSLSEAREEHTMNRVGDKLVVIGGIGASWATLSSVEILTSGGSSWQLATWPVKNSRKRHCTATLSDTEVIVIGGLDGVVGCSASVEKYNVNTGIMVQLTDLPLALAQHQCAVMNNKLFVTGGYDCVSFTPTLADVRVLDLSSNNNNNAWTSLAPMNSMRRWHAMGVANGKLAVFGGYGSWIQPTTTAESTREVYNETANQWVIEPLQIWRRFPVMAVVPCSTSG